MIRKLIVHLLVLVGLCANLQADGMDDLRKFMLEAKKMEADAKRMSETNRKQQAREYITMLAQMKRQQRLARMSQPRILVIHVYHHPYLYNMQQQQVNSLIQSINTR